MARTPQPVKAQKQPEEKTSKTISAPMLIFLTALDTTWRAFIPVLGGTFLGIAIDNWLSIAPVATILCLIAGVILSGVLIIKQLQDVRKPLK